MLPSRTQVHSIRRLFGMALCMFVMATSGGCGWFLRHAPPDPGFDLIGINGIAKHVDTKSLIARVSNALDSATQSTAVTTEAGTSSRAYRGVQIWNLVREYGLAGAPDPHGNVLDSFVLASGSDGDTALFSAGELDPSFGNTHALLAVQTAGSVPQVGPSPFLTTAPLDQRAARYVSSLVRLEVRKPPAELLPVERDVLVVDGQVDRRLMMHRADLAAMPQAHVKLDDGFEAVALWDVLQKAGIKLDPTRKGALLTMYLTATGRDGVQVVVSLAEASPSLGDRRILIVYPADQRASGEPRLVVADDVKHGRTVAQLCRIRVFDAASPQ